MNRLLAAARLIAAVPLVALAMPAVAQQGEEAPRRWRVGLGPQLVPRYPGSDKTSIRPFVDVSRTRGDEPFAFEAPDESTGFALLRRRGLAIGPALSFEGKRRSRDVGGRLPEVGFTVEAGGFVQYQFDAPIRLRGEVRQGIGGHKGLVGSVGADWVARDGDRWLVSAGPRVTLSNGRYNRAYFGVAAADAAPSGLRAFRPGGGVQAIGGAAEAIRELTPRWGLIGYAKYDRLVGDPGDSPVVRAFGSRNQWSGGVALTYSFGG